MKKSLSIIVALAMVMSVLAAFPVITLADDGSSYISDANRVFDGRYSTTGSTNDTAINSVTGWSNWSSSTASNGYINSRTYTVGDASRNVIQFYKSSGGGGSNSGYATMTATNAYGEGNDVIVLSWYPRIPDYSADNYCYYTITDADGNAFVNNICIDRNTNITSASAGNPFGRASTAGEEFRIIIVNDSASSTVYYYNSTSGGVTYTDTLNYRVNGIKQIDITIGAWMAAWRHQGMGDFCIYATNLTAISEVAAALTVSGDCNEDITTLPTTVTGYSGSTVTWASNNANVTVNNSTGVVSYTKTSAVQTATLTATISYSGDSTTKNFSVTVHANDATPSVGDRFTGSDGITYYVTSATNLIDSSFDPTGQDGSGWLGRTGTAATSNAAWSQVEGYDDCYAWQSNTSAGSGNANSMNPLIPISGLTAGNYYVLTFAAKSSANGTIEWSNVQLMDSSYAAIGSSLGTITAASGWTVSHYVFSPTSATAYISPAAGWVGSCTMDDFSVLALAPVQVTVNETYVDNDDHSVTIGTYSGTGSLGGTYTPNAPATISYGGRTYNRMEASPAAISITSETTINRTYYYTAEAITVTGFVAPSYTVIDGNDPILPTSVTANLSSGSTDTLAVSAWSTTYTTSGNVRTYTAQTYASTTTAGGYEIASGVSAPTATVTVLDDDEDVPDATSGETKYQLAKNYVGTIYTEFDLTPETYGDVWVSYTSSANSDYFGDSATRIGIDNSGYFKVVYGTNAAGSYAASSTETSTVQGVIGQTYRVLTYTDITNGTFSIWITEPNGTTTQIVNAVGFRRASDDIGYVGLAAERSTGSWDITNHKISWESGYATVTSNYYLDGTLTSALTTTKKVAPGVYTATPDATLEYNSTSYTFDSESSTTSTASLAAGGSGTVSLYYEQGAAKITAITAPAARSIISGSTAILPTTVSATLSSGETVNLGVTWSGYTAGVTAPTSTTTYNGTVSLGEYEAASGVSTSTSVTVTVLSCDAQDDIESGTNYLASNTLSDAYTGVIYTEYDITPTVRGDVWAIYLDANKTDTFNQSTARLGIGQSSDNENLGYFKINYGTGTGAGTNLFSTVYAELNSTYRVLTKIDVTNQTFQIWITSPDGSYTDISNGGLGFRGTADNIGKLIVGANGGAGRITVTNHKVYWESGYGGTYTVNAYIDDTSTQISGYPKSIKAASASSVKPESIDGYILHGDNDSWTTSGTTVTFRYGAAVETLGTWFTRNNIGGDAAHGGDNGQINGLHFLGAHDAFTSDINSSSMGDAAGSLCGDSGSRYAMSYSYQSNAKAQNSDTLELLNAGVRYFDARLTRSDASESSVPSGLIGTSTQPGTDGVFYTTHAYVSTKWENICYALKQFCEQNPGEIIIVDIQTLYDSYGDADGNATNGTWEGVRDLINATGLGAYCIPTSSGNLNGLTWSNITNNGAKAAVIFLGRPGSQNTCSAFFYNRVAGRAGSTDSSETADTTGYFWSYYQDDDGGHASYSAVKTNIVNKQIGYHPAWMPLSVMQAQIEGSTGSNLMDYVSNNANLIAEDDFDTWIETLPIVMLNEAGTTSSYYSAYINKFAKYNRDGHDDTYSKTNNGVTMAGSGANVPLSTAFTAASSDASGTQTISGTAYTLVKRYDLALTQYSATAQTLGGSMTFTFPTTGNATGITNEYLLYYNGSSYSLVDDDTAQGADIVYSTSTLGTYYIATAEAAGMSVTINYVDSSSNLLTQVSSAAYEYGDSISLAANNFWAGGKIYTAPAYSTTVTEGVTPATISVTCTVSQEYAASEDFFYDGSLQNGSNDMIFSARAGDNYKIESQNYGAEVDADGNVIANAGATLGSARYGIFRFAKPAVASGKAVVLNIYVTSVHGNLDQNVDTGTNYMRIAAVAADSSITSSSTSLSRDSFMAGGAYDVTANKAFWSVETLRCNSTPTWVTFDVTEIVTAASGDYVNIAILVPQSAVYMADTEKASYGGTYAGNAAYLEVVDGQTITYDTDTAYYTSDGVRKANGAVVRAAATPVEYTYGEPIVGSATADTSTGIVTVNITPETATSLVADDYYDIYAAVYGADGALEEIRLATSEEIALAARESDTLTFTFTSDLTGKTIMVYLWDGITTIRPIAPAYTID